MSHRIYRLSLVLVSILAGAGAGAGAGFLGGGCSTEEGTLELVGYNSLGDRGGNSALAIAGNYIYVGSRTEGETHLNAGVLIIDASDPQSPTIVGEIGPPNEGLLGISSRELRTIPERNLLIVMNFACERSAGCSRDLSRFVNTGGVAETDNFKFYDISDPRNPRLVARYDFETFPGATATAAKPHEFFLWRDPNRKDRYLIYTSTPSHSIGPTAPTLKIIDISDLGNIRVLASWDAFEEGLEEDKTASALHSVSVSDDGRVAYLAHYASGFFMLDTSDIANGVPEPKLRLLTPFANRVDYSPPAPPDLHSAVKIPHRDLVLTTDEVYNPPTDRGCPWGWVNLIDVADMTRPKVVGEYRLRENDPAVCLHDAWAGLAEEAGPPKPGGAKPGQLFTAHNPTVTDNLALVTWHAGGVQVIDTTNPSAPQRIASFVPSPLGSVAVEDRGTGGTIAMWSYPIVKDGFIYVVDIRNGLYILRYRGPYESQVNDVHFLEGNSNLK